MKSDIFVISDILYIIKNLQRMHEIDSDLK